MLPMESSSRSKTHRGESIEQIDRPFERGYVGPYLHEGDTHFDGRLLRGERSRQHIAEAMIELIEGGSEKPTVSEIAIEAGVSPRLVFHHFRDVDSIFETVAGIQAGRHWSTMATIPPAGPVGARIDAVVRQRRKLFVAIGPVRKAVLLRRGLDPVIEELIRAGAHRLREELATTFAPELAQAGPAAGVLLDSLDITAGWDTWQSLRGRGGRSSTAARRIVTYSLQALLMARPAKGKVDGGLAVA